MNNLFFNILTFDWPEKPVVFYFKEGKQDDGTTIHKSIFPKNIANFLPNANSLDFISTTFDYEKEGYTPIEINFKVENKDFIKRFYNEKIKHYFKKKNPQILKINFVKDNQIWITNQKDSTAQFKVFDKFTLSINFQEVSNFPELQISYDGQGKILKNNIYDIIEEYGSSNVERIENNNRIIKYTADLDIDLEKAFPVLNNKLRAQLSLPVVVPSKFNKYKTYLFKLEYFYKSFLNNTDFKKFIPINCDYFIDVPLSIIDRISENSNKLLFADSYKSNSPKEGFKKGPFQKANFAEVEVFFIFHESNREQTKLFYSHLFKPSTYFKGISRFIHLPISTKENSSIKFQNLDDPIPEIKKNLSEKYFDPDKKYFAVYITPFSKSDSDSENHNLYYKIKEHLLEIGISSQVIDANKIEKDVDKYGFSLQNISLAILAKLDGIPWRLDLPKKNELVVGIGAFKDTTENIQYLGSSFSFDNTGKFNKFEYFPKSELNILAGSIANSVRNYRAINKNIEQLIIHFYKKMSQDELQPIEDALNNLGLDIPITIVSINKTVSEDIIAFDKENEILMPLSGVFINLGNKKYLVFNNSLHQKDFKISNEGYPFPIKLSIDSTDKSKLEDTIEVKKLIEQVYQFSRMYWKSMKQQNLPVTIKYPEMVAQIAPHFEGNEIPQYGKDNLWFL